MWAQTPAWNPPEGLPVAKVGTGTGRVRFCNSKEGASGADHPLPPFPTEVGVSAFRNFSFNRFHLELGTRLGAWAPTGQGPRQCGQR